MATTARGLLCYVMLHSVVLFPAPSTRMMSHSTGQRGYWCVCASRQCCVLHSVVVLFVADLLVPHRANL